MLDSSARRIVSPQERKRVAPGRNRSATVYEELRQMIVSGELAPGTPVSEMEATSWFGVSRTPARAALQRLEQHGYVVASGRGKQLRMTVAPLTKDDAAEVYAVIGELEALAAGSAAVLREDKKCALVADLRRLNGRLSVAAQGGIKNAREAWSLDTSFHHSLVQSAAGPRVRTLHEAISAQAERYSRVYGLAIHFAAAQVSEHEDIIDAVSRGNTQLARDGVRAHYSSAAERLIRMIGVSGERGCW